MTSRFLTFVIVGTFLLAAFTAYSLSQTRSMIEVHHCPEIPDPEVKVQTYTLHLPGTDKTYEIPVPVGTPQSELSHWISNVLAEGGGQGPFVTCWDASGVEHTVTTPRHLGIEVHNATVTAQQLVYPKTGECGP